MSQPPPTTTTTTKIPKLHSTKAKVYDCIVFFLFITVSFILVVSVPVITRGIIFLQPETPQFNVSSSSLTILNVSSNAITANFNVTFSTKNPNRKTMSYEKVVALLLYGNGSLSTITLPPFHQPGKTQKTLQAAFPSLFFQVKDNSSSRGAAVSLTTELHAKVKYGGWTWPVEKDLIKAACDDDVKVEFPSNVTTLVFGSSECDVNGQWKRIVTRCCRIFRNYIHVVSIVLFILFVSL
ncbi:hypothetical protein NC653_002389 [Populus alba x Populus x berolinensis]|uniref:Late embryogenesis abundant protein LEA-2 subgroup domain-containing protein n=1 Tax=Populus alba x Populus x berolinensis TaxID=444605 RepID=A0AAD6RNT4_9ROSI|nr:hypothetical protein NC653_002389 [Populus alba x Populus x berolinensis]